MKRTQLKRGDKPLRTHTPMRAKSKKRQAHRNSNQGRVDLEHLGRVRSLPCIICQEWGMTQTTPSEAHHVIHDRYGSQKVPDRMTLPLCRDHHRESDDPRKVAIHQGKETWRELHGADHEWLPRILDMLEAME